MLPRPGAASLVVFSFGLIYEQVYSNPILEVVWNLQDTNGFSTRTALFAAFFLSFFLQPAGVLEHKSATGAFTIALIVMGFSM
jgi:hypothetical protein